MSPLDLIRSRDGSMSVTKLFVTVAHVLVALMFVHLQWGHEFNETLWMIYLGATVFHATYDKTVAVIKDFKDRKLQVQAGEPQP